MIDIHYDVIQLIILCLMTEINLFELAHVQHFSLQCRIEPSNIYDQLKRKHCISKKGISM